MKKSSNLFFVGVLFFVACWVIYLFKSFWLTMAIGILLAVSTANVQALFLRLTKHNRALSAGLTTICVLLIFLVPFVYAIIALAKYSAQFDIKYVTDTVNFIKHYDFKLPEAISFIEPTIKNTLSNLDISAIVNKIIGFLTTLGKGGAGFMTDAIFILIFYFFANLYGTELIDYVKKVLPMQVDDIQFILTEVANTMSVVLYSTIVNMILQGFLFSIIASIYGYDGLLLGILFAFSSLIPMVGGALIYVPISIYEVTQNGIAQGVAILAYSVICISIIADSFIKPLAIKFINEKLLHTPAKINELLIFFAMLAGISSFGFWGLILGPAIITLFLSIIKLYTLLKERNYLNLEFISQNNDADQEPPK